MQVYHCCLTMLNICFFIDARFLLTFCSAVVYPRNLLKKIKSNEHKNRGDGLFLPFKSVKSSHFLVGEDLNLPCLPCEIPIF